MAHLITDENPSKDKHGFHDWTKELILCRNKARDHATDHEISLGDDGEFLFDFSTGTADPDPNPGVEGEENVTPFGLKLFFSGSLTGKSHTKWVNHTGRAIEVEPDETFEIDGPTLELLKEDDPLGAGEAEFPNDDNCKTRTRLMAIVARTGRGFLTVRNVKILGNWDVGIRAEPGTTKYQCKPNDVTIPEEFRKCPEFTLTVEDCELTVMGTGISYFNGVERGHQIINVARTTIFDCGRDPDCQGADETTHGHGFYIHPNVIQTYADVSVVAGGRYAFKLSGNVAPTGRAVMRNVTLGHPVPDGPIDPTLQYLDGSSHFECQTLWTECLIMSKRPMDADGPAIYRRCTFIPTVGPLDAHPSTAGAISASAAVTIWGCDFSGRTPFIGVGHQVTVIGSTFTAGGAGDYMIQANYNPRDLDAELAHAIIVGCRFLQAEAGGSMQSAIFCNRGTWWIGGARVKGSWWDGGGNYFRGHFDLDSNRNAPIFISKHVVGVDAEPAPGQHPGPGPKYVAVVGNDFVHVAAGPNGPGAGVVVRKQAPELCLILDRVNNSVGGPNGVVEVNGCPDLIEPLPDPEGPTI